MHPDESDSRVSAGDLVARLQLEPHPEGGWYREVHRSELLLQTGRGPRAALTSIYFLLGQGQHSRWHVVTSDEIWHYSCGDPLELLTWRPEAREFRRQILGAPVKDEQRPIGPVRAGDWQAARSLGAWTLMGCDVGPGFDFEDFTFVSSITGHEQVFTGALAAYAALL